MPGCECRFAIADDVSFRVCGLLLLCCDSEHLAWFLLIAPALPSMEGPRQEPQDGDGTVVSALVGLPDDVLSTNAQSAATSLPAPGSAQPGNPTSSTTVAAGCSPSTYHPACASGTSTRRRHRLSRRAGTARSRSPSPSQPRLPRACARVHATLHHDVSTSAAVRRGRGRAGRGFDRGSARRRMSPPCARRLVALDLPASAAEVKPSSFARSSGRPANAATRRPVSTRQHRAVAHGNRSALGAHVARGGQASQAAEGSHT